MITCSRVERLRMRSVALGSIAVFVLAVTIVGVAAAGFALEPTTGYLEPNERLDGMALLTPPPVPGSPSDLADRSAFRSSRALEGSARWDLAVIDLGAPLPRGLRSFSCATGTRLENGGAPALERLMQGIVAEAIPVLEQTKRAFARPRPYQRDDGPVCGPPPPQRPTGDSYPSGHAMIGWAWSLVLAELGPDRASPILARGRAFGESRVVCGYHYPSDIEAGRIAGAALIARLHAQAELQEDLNRAAIEIDVLRYKRITVAECRLEQEALLQSAQSAGESGG